MKKRLSAGGWKRLGLLGLRLVLRLSLVFSQNAPEVYPKTPQQRASLKSKIDSNANCQVLVGHLNSAALEKAKAAELISRAGFFENALSTLKHS